MIPADTGVVFPDTTTGFSERKTGKDQIADNIPLFFGKMMVRHDGPISDLSVGGASLYQKIPSSPLCIS